MSKTAPKKEEHGEDIPLGKRNPANPAQRRVRCLTCPAGSRDRWVALPRGCRQELWADIEACGWIKSCSSCVTRAGNSKNVPVKLPTGSVYHYERRISLREIPTDCGICGEEHIKPPHYDNRKPNGFCKDCRPLSFRVLKPEHYEGPSEEREIIYANIALISKTLKAARLKAPESGRAPFCVVADMWDETNKGRPGATSISAMVRGMILYFSVLPIRELSTEKVLAFRERVREEEGHRGTRTQSCIRQYVNTLRRIYDYAMKHGWVEFNPVPPALEAPPPVDLEPLKSDRLLTVEEERKLLTACVGEFADLWEPIICLVDTGIREAERLRLIWSDVEWEESLLHVSGRKVKMTPRLLEAVRAVHRRSGGTSQGSIWDPRKSQRLRLHDLCASIGLNSLTVDDLRRTFAWRYQQAGNDIFAVKAALGIRGLDNVGRFLKVNSAIAEQEAKSKSFRQFIEEQFAVSQNSNGQKNGNGVEGLNPRRKREPLTTVNGKSLEDLDSSILKLYDEKRVNSLVTLELVAQDAGLGRVRCK